MFLDGVDYDEIEAERREYEAEGLAEWEAEQAELAEAADAAGE